MHEDDYMKHLFILTESSSVPYIYKNAIMFGYKPIFLYTIDAWDINNDYRYELIDFSKSEMDIAKYLKGKYEDIVGVVSCIEQLTYKMAKISEFLGVSINNRSSYTNLRDKKAMKECWEQNGVSTPKSYGIFHNANIDRDDLHYPVIVKPVFGAASAGVKKIFSFSELQSQIKQILRYNLTTLANEGKVRSGFIIEQFVTGAEYSVDTIWVNGKPILSGILSKSTPKEPDFPDRLYFTDTELDYETRAKILEETYKGISAAGVKNGCTHTEVRVMDGKVFLIEAALRPGAGGALYRILTESTEIDFYKYLIIANTPSLIAAYNNTEEIIVTPPKRFFWYNVSYEGAGKIKGLDVKKELAEDSNIKSVIFRRKIGSYLPREGMSSSYLAWVIGLLPESVNSEFEIESYMNYMDNNIIVSYG